MSSPQTPPQVPGDRSPAELALGVAALRRENEQQQAQLDELRQDVHLLLTEVTESFTAITRRLDEGAAGPAEAAPGAGSGPRNWKDLDGEQQRQLWADLLGWLSWLHGRFPLLGRVPACWWRHTAAVELLTGLYNAWAYAYEDPQAPASAQAEWLDRWLPSTVQRLAEWVPRPCLTGTHADDPATRYGRAVDDPEQYRVLTDPN